MLQHVTHEPTFVLKFPGKSPGRVPYFKELATLQEPHVVGGERAAGHGMAWRLDALGDVVAVVIPITELLTAFDG